MYVRSRVVVLAILVAALVVVAMLWAMGQLEGLWRPDWLQGVAERFAGSAWLPVAVLGVVVLGQQLAVPQTLLVAGSVLVLGLWEGFAVTFVGTVVGATVSYFLGRWVGRYPLRRYAGWRIRRVSRLLAKRGVMSMIIVNLLPIGPHTVVNLAAGTSHIRFRDFFWGTAIGVIPQTLVVAVLTDLLVRVARVPTPGEAFLAMLIAGFVALAGWYATQWAWRWLGGNGDANR